ncbi:hypothetical protein K435DRAFT_862519 [Dendrothele bispora CBS 962.96]|uniref:Uncharacterized protein n=1 Tax=Dendrothele bispora (strain CBS 962.96) TaxID=1314807 RepID=A0A4S8LSX2_DENBC|nr:hypothetical protein K435DRAFT_862519 [Dendrothele bispora CBS 962.96]
MGSEPLPSSRSLEDCFANVPRSFFSQDDKWHEFDIKTPLQVCALRSLSTVLHPILAVNMDDYPPGGYLIRYPPRMVRDLLAYLDTALNDDDHRMIFFIISNTERYRRIHLCPGYLRSGRPYHRLTMLRMDFDRHLCRLSEEYQARCEYRYELTADGPVYLPATRPLSPSPPPFPLSIAPPPSLPLPPSQAQVSGPAAPTTQQEHPQDPPPPYTPPVLSIAGFTGVGTRADPVNLDSVEGTGTSTDPIDLCGDDESD